LSSTRQPKKNWSNETSLFLKFLYHRVGKQDDPRRIGERLHGTLSEFWKYRVGDYHLICSLENDRLRVLVLRIGHRREVYKR